MIDRIVKPALRWARTALVSGLILSAPVAHAQENDRGFLQGLIEDNLSTQGRDVKIEGFEGALSSEATLDLLTIADADGIWLTVKDVTLDWNRSALLVGTLDVTKFAAGEIILERLPNPETGPDLPQAEASGFTLPDLPVSVNIEEIAAKKVVLGKPVLGEKLSLSLEGSMRLEDGEGQAKLEVSRLDRTSDFVSFEASYSNADRNLGIDLTLQEQEGGIASSLLGIPGAPSITLSVEGDAPLDDFTAQIALSTDGQQRLGGTVTIKSPQPDPDAEGDTPPIRFAADIQGDIAPVFAPDYRDFFGPDISLSLQGSKPAEGGLSIRDLSLKAAALRLDGQLEVGPDNWPERFNLTGELASKDGSRVLLPLSGPKTELDSLDLALRYERASGDDWRMTLDARGLEREDLSLRRAQLTGGGTLSKGEGATPGQVTGALDYVVQDLALQDPDLAAALGEALKGKIEFSWQEQSPFRLQALTLEGEDYRLDGTAEISGISKSASPRATASLTLSASNLERFTGIAETDLSGAADLNINASFQPTEGKTRVSIEGTARDLGFGQPRLDPLLAGETVLSANLRRGPTGTYLEWLRLTSPQTTLSASADWKTDQSRAALSLTVNNFAVVEPSLDGPATLSLTAQQTERSNDIWQFQTKATGPGEAKVTADGTIGLTDGKPGEFSVQAEASAADLSRYAPLAERDLGGAVDLKIDANGDLETRSGDIEMTVDGQDLALGVEALDRNLRGRSQALLSVSRAADGSVTLRRARITSPRLQANANGALQADGAANVDLEVTGDSLSIGNEQVDRLLRGRSTLTAEIARDSDGTLTIDRANLTTPQLSAEASGTIGTSGSSSAQFNARLADVALLAPGFPGPATVRGTIRGDGETYIVEADATGPAGMTANVSGRIGTDRSLNLGITGQAPLALANPVLSPRSLSGVAQFDLRVDGPPALSSVSGTVTTRGAGLALPNAKLALSEMNANVSLDGGGAQISMTASVSTGGQIAINGRVGLDPPFQSDLAIDLRGVGITDPALYSTTADGRITFNGPAAGGATIAGTANLGEVNVRVPDGAISSGVDLPGLRHVNEPADVRQTRAFAELISNGTSQSGAAGAAGPAYDLSIVVNAPSRIFIRGRGLDAELGGSLRLRGNTKNIIPEGQFDLIRGRLDILGKRLTLTDGYLRMRGSFEPYLYLVAETTSGEVQIIIVVEGPASQPDITFSSQPELPEDQVLSQLIFERDISQISAFQALQLASAVATLAGKGGDGVVGKLRSSFGLDDLDLTTGPDDTTEVRAGKYLSENVYSEVEVDSEGQSQINLNLDINKNLKAKGSFGAGGDSGLGIFFEKDY